MNLRRLLLLISVLTLGGLGRGADPNPFFAMDTIAKGGPEIVAPLLQEFGYAGLGGKLGDRPMADALTKAGLKFFNGYVTVALQADVAGVPQKSLADPIKALQGLWFLVVVALPVAALGAPAAASESSLLSVATNAQAGSVERAATFTELRPVATEQSVPALAALLRDPTWSYAARSVLESIPGPAAERALLDALAATTDNGLRIGLVNSLGSRHAAAAVPAIAESLSSPDAALADAALNALGNIGTAAAANALSAHQPSGAMLAAWSDAMLRAAEAFQTTDRSKAATFSNASRTRALRHSQPPQRWDSHGCRISPCRS